MQLKGDSPLKNTMVTELHDEARDLQEEYQQLANEAKRIEVEIEESNERLRHIRERQDQVAEQYEHRYNLLCDKNVNIGPIA